MLDLLLPVCTPGAVHPEGGRPARRAPGTTGAAATSTSVKKLSLRVISSWCGSPTAPADRLFVAADYGAVTAHVPVLATAP
jgi:hypothetical protein